MEGYYPLLSEPGAFWTPTLVLAAMFGVRYVVFAGIAWMLGYGNGAAARKTVQEALSYAEGLPEGQRSEATIEALRKQLGEFSAAGHPQ